MADSSGPISRNLLAEALEIAVRWPNPAPATVLALTGQYIAAGRYAEAYRVFDDIATGQPDQPLLLAVAGSFQARLPGQFGAAMARLDAAVAKQPGLPQYFRGLALAAAPAELGTAEQAVADLEFVLSLRDRIPVGLLRPVYQALAGVYRQLGRTADADETLHKSGHASHPDLPALTSDFWVTDADGFRFTSPRLTELAPDVFVAQGYDFADFAFVRTADSVVAIDAGSTVEHVEAALRALREITDLPVSHVILTHAHFDHIGGVGALRGRDTTVIAQANFATELDIQNRGPVRWGRFLPAGASRQHELTPDHLVETTEMLTVGGVTFRLYPVHGGETDDALVIHLPDRGVAFTGDMLMPYVGAPFFSEGSLDGLIEAMELVEDLRPRLIIQGHPPLTGLFTVDVLPGLRAALASLRDVIDADVSAGRSVFDILARNHLPELLRDHPAAVQPYLALRDNAIRRFHRQHTGYWQSDVDSVDPLAPGEWADVLDVLTGGAVDTYVGAVRDLLARGDVVPAFQLADLAVRNHGDSAALVELRQQALYGLVERHQFLAPFKFIVYSELAGIEVPPIG